jgi:hypothetical protein
MASTAIGREASCVSSVEPAERAPIASTAVATRSPVTKLSFIRAWGSFGLEAFPRAHSSIG